LKIFETKSEALLDDVNGLCAVLKVN